MRRFSDQTMKIEGGRMTSCDLAEPHYHFWSKRMKMRPGDKVVAAPIVLRIGNVPIFALPFYFKNLKDGRRSGILFPSFDFGWSSREGRYVRDLGYYWAINDYLDFLVQGDYNEKSDMALRSSVNYVKRYSFSGGLDWSRRDGLGDDDSSQWQMQWNHNQPALFDDYEFRADVRLASNKLSRNELNSSGTRDIVSGQFKSSAYISRNWKLVSASLNASRDGRVNAEDDLETTDNLLYSMTLPSLALNFRQLALKPALGTGQRGSLWGDLLRATYFQQGYSFKQDRRGYEEHDVRVEGASGNWSLRVQPPRLGIFNFGLNANARQSWQRETTSGRQWVVPTGGTGSWQPLDGTSETTSPAVSFGASLGTTLYGLFPVELGRLRAIRHTVRMSSSWNVSPALGDKQPYSTSLSLSLDQRFDVKYSAAGGDTTEADRKLDGVIDWSLSTSYSPNRPEGERWGDIASGLTIKPGQSRYLQLKVSNTIDAAAPGPQGHPLQLRRELQRQGGPGPGPGGNRAPSQPGHRAAGAQADGGRFGTGGCGRFGARGSIRGAAGGTGAFQRFGRRFRGRQPARHAVRRRQRRPDRGRALPAVQHLRFAVVQLHEQHRRPARQRQRLGSRQSQPVLGSHLPDLVRPRDGGRIAAAVHPRTRPALLAPGVQPDRERGRQPVRLPRLPEGHPEPEVHAWPRGLHGLARRTGSAAACTSPDLQESPGPGPNRPAPCRAFPLTGDRARRSDVPRRGWSR